MLWALYADSCNGICVEYELSKINKAAGGNLNFKPIHYQKSRYAPNTKAKNDDEIIFESLWKKSLLWSFEQEIRAVVMDEGDKAAPIDSKNAHIEPNRLKRGRDFEWQGKYDNSPDNKQPFVYKDKSSFYLHVEPKQIYLGPLLSALDAEKDEAEKDLLKKLSKDGKLSEHDKNLYSLIDKLKKFENLLSGKLKKTSYSKAAYKVVLCKNGS